jgi:formylmethanofuran dehydrogenase subunit E
MSRARSDCTSERALRDERPARRGSPRAGWLGALALLGALTQTACAEPKPKPTYDPHGLRGAPGVHDDTALLEVTRVHGGHGPWAVLGYRMGRFALAKLGLERFDFDLEITHASPREVQYSCIADGASAATGASLGKLNLTLEEASAARVETRFRRRSTGQLLVLRPTARFVERFRDVPRAELGRRGREVLWLGDDELFEEVSRP